MPNSYAEIYQDSITNPDAFWAKQALQLDWVRKWDKVKNASFTGDVKIKWFEGGELNAAYNCIDRHLETNAEKTAIIWESDDGKNSKHITYQELHQEVCKLANALQSLGVKKGDRVTIYLPMIPEAAYSMLACARIGAIHSVVFAGFSPDSLAGRIDDCKSDFIITSDFGLRGGKKIPLKDNVDAALKITKHKVKTVIVVNHPSSSSGSQSEARGSREEDASSKRSPSSPKRRLEDDVIVKSYDDITIPAPTTHTATPFESETPLFILYTSGSTGQPKGILHTTAGYLLYAAYTHQTAFALQANDIYWCTADIGWITGHSYLIYGPLANGCTTLMFEGVPTYPDASRFWQIVDKYNVNIFYTAPTAIRSLQAAGDEFTKSTTRKSLRVLGTVGEPINPEAWHWYNDVIGHGKCPIIDTWWQTETGGFMITPIAGETKLKPGSATLPFYGIEPILLPPTSSSGSQSEARGSHEEDASSKRSPSFAEGKLEDDVVVDEGALCIKSSWPGQARTIYGDHQRFIKTYFTDYPGYYFSGDGARCDKDGYYWITGRTDDVIKVSGHRIGSAEVESALASNEQVAEAAVVAIAHQIKGQAIYAYIVPKSGSGNDALAKDLITHVRKQIGPITAPEHIHFTTALPKTRSGKIMRRILRKIAGGDYEDLGDTSTLLNPEIIAELIKTNKAIKT